MAISCVGWVTNHFVGTRFPGQSDITAAVGYVLPFVYRPLSVTASANSAFAVGVVANIYGRLFNGNAFVVMVTSTLFPPAAAAAAEHTKKNRTLCTHFANRSPAYCFSCPRVSGTEGCCTLRRSRLLGARRRTSLGSKWPYSSLPSPLGLR